MSWPVGYGVADVHYATARDGAIIADGVTVTGANGWIELRTASELRGAGVPDAYALRLRLAVDAEGNAFFFAEEVELGGVRYRGLFALAKSRGGTWLSAPVRAARDALEARRLAGLLAAATVRKASGQ